MSHREIFIYQILLSLKDCLSTKGLLLCLGVDVNHIDVIAKDNDKFNTLRSLYNQRRLSHVNFN